MNRYQPHCINPLHAGGHWIAQVAHDATRSKTVPHNDQKVITEPRCDHTGTDPRRPMIYSQTGRTATPCSTKATSSSTHTHTHTRLSALCPGLPGWAGKGKTNLDFTEARDSEWQWHLLGHMQVCTSLQTDNHASTSPFSFLQAGCPSCRPTNSVKALKTIHTKIKHHKIKVV